MEQTNKQIFCNDIRYIKCSWLGNLSTGKEVIRAGEETVTASEGTIRADQDF